MKFLLGYKHSNCCLVGGIELCWGKYKDLVGWILPGWTGMSKFLVGGGDFCHPPSMENPALNWIEPILYSSREENVVALLKYEDPFI